MPEVFSVVETRERIESLPVGIASVTNQDDYASFPWLLLNNPYWLWPRTAAVARTASQWSWKLHRRVLCPTRFVSAMQFGVLGCPKWKVPQWYLKNNPESSKTKVFSQRTAAKFNFPLHLHNISYSLDITYITCIIYINPIYYINFIYIHVHRPYHLHVVHHLDYLLQLHLHHIHHLHHLQQHHLHHLHQHHLHGRVLASSWHVGLYP